MSNRPMPLYCADLLAETAHLTVTEFGAYMLLLANYWTHDGLSFDEGQLARIVNCSPRMWKKLRPKVAAMFGPNWSHAKLDVELQKKRRGGGWGIPPQPINRCQTPLWRATRLRIFARDDFTCRYCGQRGGQLECDHVLPASRGGPDSDDNLATACKACNRSKRASTPEEWQ